ncbi:MAG: carboxyl transferase [Eubacterium sp.]|nr:carboxyl transferase [Eubacterium sp.]
MSTNELFLKLFDEGVFTELEAGFKCELVIANGLISGVNSYAFSFDADVNKGAVSVASCKKILKVYKLARLTGAPVIGIYSSNGVKLDEGSAVIDAYGEVVKEATSLSGVVPQISYIESAALGVTALIANLADVVICNKNADFYVSAPSDITAEQCAFEGTVDILSENGIEDVRRLISYLPENNLSSPPVLDYEDSETADYKSIEAIADKNSVIEFKKDYAKGVRCALATVKGITTGFISFGGDELKDTLMYKAEAFVKLCDAYNISIVTLANGSGITKENESRTLTALTKLTSAYASATCPKISVITEKAIGAAYITLAGKGANADYVIALSDALVSSVDIDSAVAFFMGERLASGEDRELLKTEYINNCATVYTAAENGSIDEIIEPENIRQRVVNALEMLSSKRELTVSRKHSVK